MNTPSVHQPAVRFHGKIAPWSTCFLHQNKPQTDTDDAVLWYFAFRKATLPEYGTEDNGEDNKPPVPVVVVVDGRHAEEHEDGRLGAARQHLHGVLDRRLRLARHVALHIIL